MVTIGNMSNVNYAKYWGLAVAIGIGLILAWTTRPRVIANAPQSSRDETVSNDVSTEGASTALPLGHPDISTEQPQLPDGTMSGHTHVSPSAAGDGVPVGQVTKASGPLGRTVAEVYADRKKLEGQRVTVRGVVVRSTSGVLGRTFIHLRDGSGNVQNGDHDLTVTTNIEKPVGATVTLFGTVVLDKDFGAGYRYPVVLEQAVEEGNN
jgi:hypothetical protein